MPTLAVTKHLAAVDLERARQRADDPLGGLDGRGVLVTSSTQDRELVAAQAGDRVARRSAHPAGARRRPQQRVAGEVTEPVVDRLEVVEVEEQHGSVAAALAADDSACSTRSMKSARLASPVSGSWNAWCRSCSSASLRAVTSRR